jgi:hypothetical protein
VEKSGTRRSHRSDIKLYCKRWKKLKKLEHGGTRWSHTGITNKIIPQKVEKVE